MVYDSVSDLVISKLVETQVLATREITEALVNESV